MEALTHSQYRKVWKSEHDFCGIKASRKLDLLKGRVKHLSLTSGRTTTTKNSAIGKPSTKRQRSNDIRITDPYIGRG